MVKLVDGTIKEEFGRRFELLIFDILFLKDKRSYSSTFFIEVIYFNLI